MKKNKIILLFILLVFISVPYYRAQSFYFTPTIGIKADVNNNDKIFDIVNKDNYFQYSSPYVSFTGLSPLLFGFNFEYKKEKNIYGLGLVVGDQANSETKVFFYQKNSDPYHNYIGAKGYGNYAGKNIYAKIPLTYKREIFSLNTKNDDSRKIFTININTGLNLLFLKTKNTPQLNNPLSWGKTLTDFGDSVEFVGYEGHMRHSFSTSFNLGLDFDFYVKGKRRFIAQFYFEQGTRKISHSLFGVYLNDELKYYHGATSRGSAINFKLAFPINIYNKKN
jgi:hypothetical protein